MMVKMLLYLNLQAGKGKAQNKGFGLQLVLKGHNVFKLLPFELRQPPGGQITGRMLSLSLWALPTLDCDLEIKV